MSEDWAVGDLAVCVDASPCRASDCRGEPWPMAEGSVWTVSWIGTSPSSGRTLLRFEKEPPLSRPYKMGWRTERFRKIRPDEHTDCEPEFIKLLNRSKPKAPSPKERETRILEALFPQSTPEEPEAGNRLRSDK